MKGLRNEAWLAPCALSMALSCLPESDDLDAYAAEWSPPSGAGAPSAPMGSAGVSGVAGSASERAPDAGAGAGGGGAGVDAGVGGSVPSLDGGGPAQACADGVLGPDQASCYRVSEAGAPWQSARDQCVAWQGALVRVDTEEEDQLIGNLALVSQWLGASDIALDNTFVWTDGSPVVFGNWGPAQPDSFPGPDCVEKRDDPDRLWYDQPCSNVRAFVCERAITIAP